jgi:hypothetical protein
LKRLVTTLVVILALAALTFWGNRLIGRALDAELGPLLAKQLGLPVRLAPITTHLMQLKASSGKLVMGDPQDPAVVATDVQVTLSWSDLLHGELRLVSASATDLMVRPSRWPNSNTPSPQDYRFLDPWLPRILQLGSGQYISNEGDSHPISQLLWQRQPDGSATANWSETHSAGELAVEVKVTSLKDLLQLTPVNLELAVAIAGKPDSAIAVKAAVQPGTTSAYSMQIDLQAATLSAHIAATGETSWSLPDHSETTMPLLDTKLVLDFFNSYRDSHPVGKIANVLDATLPQVQLPTHRGHVAIAEIRMEDEIIGRDNAFDFTSGEQGLQISTLTSNGPAGILNGELGVVSNAQGWTVNVNASLLARENEKGVALEFVGSDWLWRTGRATLAGRGDTWGALLNSLQGDVALAGDYHGSANPIPVAIEGRLDNRPDEIGLDSLTATFGDLQVSGSARMSGTERRKLTMDLKGSHVDLGFLFDSDETQSLPGIPLPVYLGSLPDLDLDLTIDVQNLQAPGLSLGHARATLERTAQGGKFVATASGTDHGTLDLTLQATTPPDRPSDVQLTANFTQLDIPGLFRQKGLVNSRSSGSLNFESQGKGMRNVFSAMRGEAKLAVEVRSDNDWRRASSEQEKLELSGNSSLVIENERIVGVKIEQLNLDSIEQDITGDLQMVASRSPWLVADLESKMLNVTGLLALLPASTAEADQAGLVPSLKRLGAVQVSLNANSLRVEDAELSAVRLKVATAPNLMTIEQFDFVSQDLTLKTQGKITWQGQSAQLESTAQLTDVDLDQFLIQHIDAEHIPVSGTVQILSEGSRIDELIANVTGNIDLQADPSQQYAAPQARRRLTMKAFRIPNGVQADITSLQWGESELAGSVRYHRTCPPMLEVEVQRGVLSLLPWESAFLNADKKELKQPSGTALGAIARASASLVGDVLLTPLKFLTRDKETAPGERVFSTDPLPLDSLKQFNMKVSGQLNSLFSNAITVKDLQFASTLKNGRLAVQASSGRLSRGKGEITLALDSKAVPPSFKLTSTFENVHGLANRDTFPRSAFISLEGQGQSQADIAASANGLIFLELGQGPFDYANSALLTANLATTMFQILIPGINRQQHQLECGTALALFQNGKGSTPYGFVARTNQANLVGHLKVDLRKENLEMNIDSRGRQGIGLSIGSVFSNTVQIRGSLTNPRIVPNTTGILWRTWAAVTTGGLSILGESLVKRIWASSNPCDSVKRIIVENVCPVNPIAASSPMVCPKAP